MSRCFSVFVIIAFLCIVRVNGQQNHFIYIQADDKQPFTAVIDRKKYNSSDAGYVVIPKLVDGEYKLAIDFAKKTFAEQVFTITIKKKDAGYALKNYAEKGWGLYNLTSMEIIMAGEVSKASDDKIDSGKIDSGKETAKINAFGEMLSEVVNDSNLTKQTETVYTPVVPADKKSTTESAEKNSETNNDTAITNELINESKDVTEDAEVDLDKVNSLAETRGVIKASEQNGREGTDLVFVDFNSKGNDTIRVFIPAATNTSKNNSDIKSDDKNFSSDAKTDSAVNDSANNKQPVAKQITNPFFTKEAKPDSTDNNGIAKDTASATNTLLAVNSNCNKMISESELNKLKKKMIEEANTDKMILIVKKALKGKCITTDEVKNLGGLFLSDEARYNFYDAAYPFVYDAANYPGLANQLLDANYKKRFQSLMH